MKLILSFFFLTGILCSSCKGKETKDPGEIILSEQSAKEDLLLFKSILEEAHPSLVIYKRKEQLNRLFDSLHNSLDGTISFRTFYNGLQHISNEIGCSHTEASLPGYVYDTLQNRKFFFPYVLLWIENKLLVNISGYELTEGTQIISINGTPAREILKSLSMYNPVEGFPRGTQLSLAAKNFALQYYLKWGAKDQFVVKATDTLGKTVTRILKPVTLSEWEERNFNDKYYYDPTDVDYDLTMNDKSGYAYLRLPTLDFYGSQRMAAFENFCANSFELLSKKRNITRLIVDIRENSGGKLYGACLLFSYLAKKPFVEFDYVTSKINTLPYSEYLDNDFVKHEESRVLDQLENSFKRNKKGYYNYADSLIDSWEPDPNRFTGQVYVITNATTVSAASYFALMVKYSGTGKIVGEETAGGAYSGNGFKTLEYVLPRSGIRFFFPYAHMVYSLREDKNSGRGLIPDYIIPDTYQSFKKNEDIQVKYILDSLNLK